MDFHEEPVEVDEPLVAQETTVNIGYRVPFNSLKMGSTVSLESYFSAVDFVDWTPPAENEVDPFNISAWKKMSFTPLSRSIDPNLGLIGFLQPLNMEDCADMNQPWNLIMPASNSTSFYKENEDAILVIGGLDPLNSTDNIVGSSMFLYLCSSKSFQYCGTMPEPRNYHAVALIGSSVYITGGFSPLVRKNGEMLATSSTYILLLNERIWERCADMNIPRSFHAMVAFKNRLYVFGGRNNTGKIIASVEIYYPDEDAWREITCLPKPLMGLCTVCTSDSIFIIGGVTSENSRHRCQNLSADIFVYDVLTSSWDYFDTLPKAVAFSAATIHNNTLWIVGGATLSATEQQILCSSNTVYRLCMCNNQQCNSSTWCSTDALLYARHALSISSVDDDIHIIGGMSSNEQRACNRVEILNTKTVTSTEIKHFPASIAGCATILLQKKLCGVKTRSKKVLPCSTKHSRRRHMLTAIETIGKTHAKYSTPRHSLLCTETPLAEVTPSLMKSVSRKSNITITNSNALATEEILNIAENERNSMIELLNDEAEMSRQLFGSHEQIITVSCGQDQRSPEGFSPKKDHELQGFFRSKIDKKYEILTPENDYENSIRCAMKHDNAIYDGYGTDKDNTKCGSSITINEHEEDRIYMPKDEYKHFEIFATDNDSENRKQSKHFPGLKCVKSFDQKSPTSPISRTTNVKRFLEHKPTSHSVELADNQMTIDLGKLNISDHKNQWIWTDVSKPSVYQNINFHLRRSNSFLSTDVPKTYRTSMKIDLEPEKNAAEMSCYSKNISQKGRQELSTLQKWDKYFADHVDSFRSNMTNQASIEDQTLKNDNNKLTSEKKFNPSLKISKGSNSSSAPKPKYVLSVPLFDEQTLKVADSAESSYNNRKIKKESSANRLSFQPFPPELKFDFSSSSKGQAKQCQSLKSFMRHHKSTSDINVNLEGNITRDDLDRKAQYPLIFSINVSEVEDSKSPQESDAKISETVVEENRSESRFKTDYQATLHMDEMSFREQIEEHIEIPPFVRALPVTSYQSIQILSFPTILTTGGIDLDNQSDKSVGKLMLLFHPLKKRWENAGSMPQERIYHSATVFQGSIYITGGYTSQEMKSSSMTWEVISYNLNEKRWRKRPNMLHSRAFHATIVVGEKLYVIGGRDNTERLLSSMEAFDGNVWRECAPMPYPVLGTSVTAIDGDIYVFGGITYDNGDEAVISHSLVYSPKLNSWNFSLELECPTAYSGVYYHKKRKLLWFVGGLKLVDGQLESSKDVCQFNPSSQEWSRICELSVARHSAMTVNIGSYIYVIGGYSTVSFCGSVDANELIYPINSVVASLAPFPAKIAGVSGVRLPAITPKVYGEESIDKILRVNAQ